MSSETDEENNIEWKKNKDWNLSEKRKELFGEARIKEFPIALIFLRLEKQDKEFIKRLKKNFCTCYDNDIGVMKCKNCLEIDTLAGSPLAGGDK